MITHPATTTHRAVPAEQRAEFGIGDGLVRISVGLEDAEDIIADLTAALEAV
ncbi:PLP-dependent transferase [Oceanibaculum nanhaiense]|uniref:PLP-dependent transferase n=1 Tax=Oceanibaculum nanhaiense TaxID=1909734 RepID=UPI0039757068